MTSREKYLSLRRQVLDQRRACTDEYMQWQVWNQDGPSRDLEKALADRATTYSVDVLEAEKTTR